MHAPLVEQDTVEGHVEMIVEVDPFRLHDQLFAQERQGGRVVRGRIWIVSCHR